MTPRTRGDLCPGVLRPWPAADGALVRLRLVGGALAPESLAGLLEVAERHGDGEIHLTRRANLQLRALPSRDGCLDASVVAAIEATGLLPSRTHELVRNILVSPLTGLVDAPHGGRIDLRPVAAALDAGLCADPAYAALSARFLFVLDDGRGDVVDRRCDLGLVALDDSRVQLRVGDAWGGVVRLDEAVDSLLALARAFVDARGTGASAPWHVTELDTPLRDPEPRHGAAPDQQEPPALGTLAPGIVHVAVPDGRLDRAWLEELLAHRPEHLVVTPWRSVVSVTMRPADAVARPTP